MRNRPSPSALQSNFSHILLVACCLTLAPLAQSQPWTAYPEADALLVAPMYGQDFEAVEGAPERWVAERLMKYDMQGLVDNGIIHRNDMKGLALPLGVHGRKDYFVDFAQGMLDMWREKALRADRNNSRIRASVMVKALDFVEIVRFQATRSSLRGYRNQVLAPAIAEVRRIHDEEKEAYSKARGVFMDTFMDNFSPNVMLGYNIQELVPPTHMVGREILKINPLFKAYYLDLVLKEGGMEVLEGFPARFDVLLSHGPFQMTDLAIAGINGNRRLFDACKKYKSVKELNTIEDHALVAAIFAYYNWEMLSYSLQASGQIETFNRYFSGRLGKKKRKNLRILIAGLTACMHHKPSTARRMLRQALRLERPGKVHYQILSADASGRQMDKYYRSAAEAYLLMKVYHILVGEYGQY